MNKKHFAFSDGEEYFKLLKGKTFSYFAPLKLDFQAHPYDL